MILEALEDPPRTPKRAPRRPEAKSYDFHEELTLKKHEFWVPDFWGILKGLFSEPPPEVLKEGVLNYIPFGQSA